jgi:hypothetical protein
LNAKRLLMLFRDPGEQLTSRGRAAVLIRIFALVVMVVLGSIALVNGELRLALLSLGLLALWLGSRLALLRWTQHQDRP